MLTVLANRLGRASRFGVRTFLQTFTATFSVSLLGWLADVQRWAGGSGGNFPSVSPLGKAAAAALVAGVAGLIAYGQNKGEQAAGVKILDPAKAPDAPPTVAVDGGTVVLDVDASADPGAVADAVEDAVEDVAARAEVESPE